MNDLPRDHWYIEFEDQLRLQAGDLEISLFLAETGTGAIVGTMAFDRKDYGMNNGIPFIKIADRVEVNIDIHAKRVSGSPVTFKE